MSFQRARNEEQMAERWDEIISATLAIYDSTPYHEITLTQIAKNLSFTRVALYKYATSKEEIFLQVILRELENWIADVAKHFEKHQDLSIGEFASAWSKLLTKHKRMVMLFALLHTIMEKNVRLESLVEYKKDFLATFWSLIDVIRKGLPELSSDQANDFLGFQFGLSSGVLPILSPGPMQIEAMQLAGYPKIEMEFEKTMSDIMENYLYGLLNKPS